MNTQETLRLVSDYLPAPVRESIRKLDDRTKRQVQEIRLRAARPVSITAAGQTAWLTPGGALTQSPAAAIVPTQEALTQSLQAVMSYSLHSHQEDLAAGFVTIRGGCRVGLCGTAVREGEQIRSVKQVGSLNFRIAGEFPGTASSVFRQLGGMGGILVAGAPGTGKTTFLRDLCRLFGDRHRTALIDERGEIAASYRGVPQHDVGLMTDVLDGYPRAEGILTALRVLNPEQILCDELSSPEDVSAVLTAAGCGAQLTASVHAGSPEELERREILAPLLHSGAFRYCVMLSGVGRVCTVRRIS